MGERGPKPRDPIATVLTNFIPEPNSGCFLWCGPVDSYGYGILVTPSRKWKAHRLSLMLHHSLPAPGMEACHSCDVPACINPGHLFWGSHAQNMADARAKGRNRNVPRLGVDHHKAKITEADVLAIRASREASTATARQYGLDPSTIRDIRRRKIWKHVA